MKLTPGNEELTKRKPYAGNPHVRFDEGSEGEIPPPTLLWEGNIKKVTISLFIEKHNLKVNMC